MHIANANLEGVSASDLPRPELTTLVTLCFTMAMKEKNRFNPWKHRVYTVAEMKVCGRSIFRPIFAQLEL